MRRPERRRGLKPLGRKRRGAWMRDGWRCRKRGGWIIVDVVLGIHVVGVVGKERERWLRICVWFGWKGC